MAAQALVVEGASVSLLDSNQRTPCTLPILRRTSAIAIHPSVFRVVVGVVNKENGVRFISHDQSWQNKLRPGSPDGGHPPELSIVRSFADLGHFLSQLRM